MSDSWNSLYASRRRVRDRYRRIWSVPVVKRASDLVVRALEGCPSQTPPRVLDVGANDRRLREKVVACRADALYESADPDDSFPHEYRDARDAPRDAYDVLALFEVVEHLSLADGLELLGELRRRLRPGGRLVITTPNIFVPGQFNRDATHVTPYSYDELGGVLLEAGFALDGMQLVRIYNDGLLGKLLHRVIAYPLHRTLGVDYAGSVAAVATRDPDEKPHE